MAKIIERTFWGFFALGTIIGGPVVLALQIASHNGF
jgi:hypothetical protein